MRKTFAVLFIVCLRMTVSAQTDTTIELVAPPVEQRPSNGFSIPPPEAPVSVRKLPAGELLKLKASDEYWYANAEREKPKPKDLQKQPPGGRPAWVGNLLWFLVIGVFLAIVGWYLASSNIRLFGRSSKRLAGDEEENGDTEDIFALPYEREIAKAEEKGDYRQAVRLRYLQTLRELSDRGLIDYRYGRTNNHYVSQLSQHPQHKLFSGLTRHFEYIWYGQFPLPAERYALLRADFTRFKSALG